MSYFVVDPAKSYVTAGTSFDLTFTLTYESMGDSSQFVLALSYGTEAGNLNTAEILSNANFSIEGGSQTGWEILKETNSENQPYWILQPLQNWNKREAKAICIHSSGLSANNQAGATVLNILESRKTDCCITIEKRPKPIVSEIQKWIEQWEAAMGEGLYFTMASEKSTDDCLYCFESEPAFMKSVRPFQEYWIPLLTGKQQLRITDCKTKYSVSTAYPIESFQISKGGLNTLTLRWDAEAHGVYGDYILQIGSDKPASVQPQGQMDCHIPDDQETFDVTLKTQSSTDPKVDIAYAVKQLPLPVIKNFTAHQQNNTIAPADNGFMDLAQLDQPGVVLQVAPYEGPTPPDPPPAPTYWTVHLTWDISPAVGTVKLDNDTVGYQGSQDRHIDLSQSKAVFTLTVSLDNGFTRKQVITCERGT